jgi:hypothetical protein
VNRYLALLDRRLKQRGELIYLQLTVDQSTVQCAIPAIVRALTVEQLIGGIPFNQQNFFLIISPTHINLQQWPRIPRTSDRVVVRGTQKAVQRVAPVFDAGECIRIELTVLG